MATASDYRIEDIQKVNFNGRKVTFKAFKKEGGAFVFAGTFTASASVAEDDLWAVADAKLSNLDEE